MKSQINNFLHTLQSSGHARTSFRRWYSIPAKSCRLMRPLGVPTVIRSILACRNAVVLSEVSAIWGQSCRFYGPTCFRFRSMMTTFRHSGCRLIMVQDLSLDSSEGIGGDKKRAGGRDPIDRRIRHTLNSYANARKEPRRQYIHTRTPGASVYTLRLVFCIPSSELIQSRGPPGDFRCGEIVFATRCFLLSFLIGKRGIVASDDDTRKTLHNGSRITLHWKECAVFRSNRSLWFRWRMSSKIFFSDVKERRSFSSKNSLIIFAFSAMLIQLNITVQNGCVYNS